MTFCITSSRATPASSFAPGDADGVPNFHANVINGVSEHDVRIGLRSYIDVRVGISEHVVPDLLVSDGDAAYNAFMHDACVVFGVLGAAADIIPEYHVHDVPVMVASSVREYTVVSTPQGVN